MAKPHKTPADITYIGALWQLHARAAGAVRAGWPPRARCPAGPLAGARERPALRLPASGRLFVLRVLAGGRRRAAVCVSVSRLISEIQRPQCCAPCAFLAARVRVTLRCVPFSLPARIGSLILSVFCPINVFRPQS